MYMYMYVYMHMYMYRYIWYIYLYFFMDECLDANQRETERNPERKRQSE